MYYICKESYPNSEHMMAKPVETSPLEKAGVGDPEPQLSAVFSSTTRPVDAQALIRECPAQYLWGYNRYKRPRGAPEQP